MEQEDKYAEFKNLSKRERRRRLLALFRKEGTPNNHSNRELGRIFGRDKNIIKSDKKSLTEAIAHISNKAIAFEYNLYKLKGAKELMRIIDSEKSNERDKITAVKVLLDIAEKEISWRYKLGLIDIEPPVLKIEQEQKINIIEMIKIIKETKNEGDRDERIREYIFQRNTNRRGERF